MNHASVEPTRAYDTSTDGENTERAKDDYLERASLDDDSVPAKQIWRWEGEGGAVPPIE